MIDAANTEFISLTICYAKFLASSIYLNEKKSFCFMSSYKKVKSLFAQVKKRPWKCSFINLAKIILIICLQIKDIHLRFEIVLKNAIDQDSPDARSLLLLGGFLIRYFNEVNYSGSGLFKVKTQQRQQLKTKTGFSGLTDQLFFLLVFNLYGKIIRIRTFTKCEKNRN